MWVCVLVNDCNALTFVVHLIAYDTHIGRLCPILQLVADGARDPCFDIINNFMQLVTPTNAPHGLLSLTITGGKMSDMAFDEDIVLPALAAGRFQQLRCLRLDSITYLTDAFLPSLLRLRNLRRLRLLWCDRVTIDGLETLQQAAAAEGRHLDVAWRSDADDDGD